MELHALKLGGDKKDENSGSTMAILVFTSLGAHCTEEGAHCTETHGTLRLVEEQRASALLGHFAPALSLNT